MLNCKTKFHCHCFRIIISHSIWMKIYNLLDLIYIILFLHSLLLPYLTFIVLTYYNFIVFILIYQLFKFYSQSFFQNNVRNAVLHITYKTAFLLYHYKYFSSSLIESSSVDQLVANLTTVWLSSYFSQKPTSTFSLSSFIFSFSRMINC